MALAPEWSGRLPRIHGRATFESSIIRSSEQCSWPPRQLYRSPISPYELIRSKPVPVFAWRGYEPRRNRACPDPEEPGALLWECAPGRRSLGPEPEHILSSVTRIRIVMFRSLQKAWRWSVSHESTIQ